MTVIYEPKETIYDNHLDWERRSVRAYTIHTYKDPYTDKDRKFMGYEFTIEKSEYGVEIEFERGDDGTYTRSFTHDEFEEFIRQCQWVSQCKVEQKK